MMTSDIYGIKLDRNRDGGMMGITVNGHMGRINARPCDNPGDWVWLSTANGKVRRRMTALEAAKAQAELDDRSCA
jgi:hypothetical protein